MSSILQVTGSIPKVENPEMQVSTFLRHSRLRMALAKDRAQFLAEQANDLIALSKRINRSNFAERAFNRLPSKLITVHNRLHASVLEELASPKTPRQRLAEAIFLERVKTPAYSLKELESYSMGSTQDFAQTKNI